MRARSLHGLEVTILLRDVTKVSRIHKEVVDFEVLLEDVTRVLEEYQQSGALLDFVNFEE